MIIMALIHSFHDDYPRKMSIHFQIKLQKITLIEIINPLGDIYLFKVVIIAHQYAC